MCCANDQQAKREFLKKNEGKKFFFAWKVIRNEGSAANYPRYFYAEGVNHARLPSGKIKISKTYDPMKPSGIHVFLEYEEANQEKEIWCSDDGWQFKVIRVVCYYEDLIAIEPEDHGFRQAVLNKVTIYKSDWKKFKQQ